MNTKKIALILVYIGKWPRWINLFIDSCKYNPTVDFFIFTNCEIPENNAENIKFIDLTLEKFNSLASEKLNFSTSVEIPYKLIDYKPLYGFLFTDYIKSYDFWGCIDLDLVYGDIRAFMTEDILNAYEVITSSKEFLASHFILYKNIEKINRLFLRSTDYEKVFRDKKVYNFDESGGLFKEKCDRISIKYIKPKIDSMMHIIERSNDVNILYDNYCEEQTDIRRFGVRKCKWKMKWEKGKLTNTKDNEEKMYFHFQFFKRSPFFYIPKWRNLPDIFYITRNGFYLQKEKRGLQFINNVLRKLKYGTKFIIDDPSLILRGTIGRLIFLKIKMFRYFNGNQF